MAEVLGYTFGDNECEGIPVVNTESNERAPFIELRQLDGSTAVRGERQALLGTVTKSVDDQPVEGCYAGWHFDGETLRVYSCRHGIYPLYYACNNGAIAVSPSIPALLSLGISSALDDDAVAAFLRLGFFLDCDTAFRAIRRVPPNADIRWSNGSPTVRGNYYFPPSHGLSGPRAIDAFNNAFDAAMAKPRDSDDFAVPLSGGRDSRHIAFALHAAGRTPRFYVTAEHLPPRFSEDMPIARALAEALGVPHVAVPQGPSRFEQERKHDPLVNFSSFEHAWFLPLADFLSAHVSGIYDGLGGGPLCNGTYLDQEKRELFERSDLRPLAERWIDEFGWLGGNQALEQTLLPGFYNRISREKAVARIVTELERHRAAVNPVQSFIFWNRVRAGNALVSYGIFRDLSVVSPYLDYDLVALLSGLSPEAFINHDFHDVAIRKRYPQFAGIPFEAKQIRWVRQRRKFMRYGWELFAYAAGRRRSDIVDLRFLRWRALRLGLDGRYNKARPWKPSRVHFLLRLEALVERSGGLVGSSLGEQPSSTGRGVPNCAMQDLAARQMKSRPAPMTRRPQFPLAVRHAPDGSDARSD